MVKLVYGVGVNDRKYLAGVRGKPTKEYDLWRGLLKRCYHLKYQKRNPTYAHCQASENFKSYSYFHEWCQSQIGFGQSNFQLDKDLIQRRNKLYSEDTCLFLPRELNLLLINCKASRGSLPIGVTTRKGKFLVQCSTGQPSQAIGTFDTLEPAFQAYKQVKEAYIKFKAEQWKEFIDPRAYAALLAYEVLITD